MSRRRYNLPAPNKRISRDPLRIDGPRKILMLSDIHIPYHDVPAVAAAIDYGKQ